MNKTSSLPSRSLQSPGGTNNEMTTTYLEFCDAGSVNGLGWRGGNRVLRMLL